MFGAVAQNLSSEGQAFLQLLDRSRGPVFLKEAEKRTPENDHEDNPGIYPLLQDKRNGGGKGKDQDQWAFELSQQKPQRAEPGRILDAVRPKCGELLSGAISRETADPTPKCRC